MARAAAASATGTARGTMQGSWRPWTESSAFSIASMSTVCCSRPMEGVGFTAIRHMTGAPVEIPPGAAGVVGFDLDLSGLGIDAIRIVVLAAAHGGHGKAHAKLHALYGGNPERDLSDAVLDAVKRGRRCPREARKCRTPRCRRCCRVRRARLGSPRACGRLRRRQCTADRS